MISVIPGSVIVTSGSIIVIPGLTPHHPPT